MAVAFILILFFGGTIKMPATGTEALINPATNISYWCNSTMPIVNSTSQCALQLPVDTSITYRCANYSCEIIPDCYSSANCLPKTYEYTRKTCDMFADVETKSASIPGTCVAGKCTYATRGIESPAECTPTQVFVQDNIVYIIGGIVVILMAISFALGIFGLKKKKK